MAVLGPKVSGTESRNPALAFVALLGAVLYTPILLSPGGIFLLVAAGAFLIYRAVRATSRSRRKRELWAWLDTVDRSGRVAVLDELSTYVAPDDHDRLQGLSIDADPEVRRIATRLLHKAISLLLAIAAWRLPEFDTLWLVLAAATIATLVTQPRWACVPALIWLLVVGHLFLLDLWFSPAVSPGWTEALCGGLIVFVVSMREPPCGDDLP